MIGQHEAIMNQKLITLFTWTMPDGAKPLNPKDDGQGLMLSVFTSHGLGFEFSVLSDVLDAVNESRKGKDYSNEDAAVIVTGNAEKGKLTTSPFLRELEYGKNIDGYWTYNHMIIQLEDCIDILYYLYLNFDFVFFLDHSNGHDCMRPN